MAGQFFGPDGSPLSRPEDVVKFLGKREKHWKAERSAYQAAHSWFAANGLPPSIESILNTDPAFRGAVLEKAIFESKTRLDSHGRESQTDVLAVLRIGADIAVLGVEAKVDESFGPFVHKWNDYTPAKLMRLGGLVKRLDLKSTPIGSLRYQLFHRTASTLIEAKQMGAHQAAMVVQSFDKSRAGFADFQKFADAFGTPVAEPGRLSNARKLGDVAIRLGWTENAIYLPKG